MEPKKGKVEDINLVDSKSSEYNGKKTDTPVQSKPVANTRKTKPKKRG